VLIDFPLDVDALVAAEFIVGGSSLRERAK